MLPLYSCFPVAVLSVGSTIITSLVDYSTTDRPVGQCACLLQRLMRPVHASCLSRTRQGSHSCPNIAAADRWASERVKWLLPPTPAMSNMVDRSIYGYTIRYPPIRWTFLSSSASGLCNTVYVHKSSAACRLQLALPLSAHHFWVYNIYTWYGQPRPPKKGKRSSLAHRLLHTKNVMVSLAAVS
jgi:hypothetical protein